MTPEDLQRWKENKFTQYVFEWMNKERKELNARLEVAVRSNQTEGTIKLIGGRIEELNRIQTISPEILELEEEKKDEK